MGTPILNPLIVVATVLDVLSINRAGRCYTYRRANTEEFLPLFPVFGLAIASEFAAMRFTPAQASGPFCPLLLK